MIMTNVAHSSPKRYKINGLDGVLGNWVKKLFPLFMDRFLVPLQGIIAEPLQGKSLLLTTGP